MIISHLIWCIPTGTSVLKNMEMVRGPGFQRYVGLGIMLTWQKLWVMGVASRASGSMKMWKRGCNKGGLTYLQKDPSDLSLQTDIHGDLGH